MVIAYCKGQWPSALTKDQWFINEESDSESCNMSFWQDTINKLEQGKWRIKLSDQESTAQTTLFYSATLAKWRLFTGLTTSSLLASYWPHWPLASTMLVQATSKEQPRSLSWQIVNWRSYPQCWAFWFHSNLLWWFWDSQLRSTCMALSNGLGSYWPIHWQFSWLRDCLCRGSTLWNWQASMRWV